MNLTTTPWQNTHTDLLNIICIRYAIDPPSKKQPFLLMSNCLEIKYSHSNVIDLGINPIHHLRA